MSDYLAKQMLGDEGMYAVARLALTQTKTVQGLSGLWGGFTMRFPVDLKLDAQKWKLMDCEIYIRPIRVELFGGVQGCRIDQVLNDVHFSHAFGELDKENL